MALPAAAQVEHEAATDGKGNVKAGDSQPGWPAPPAGWNELQHGEGDWETPGDADDDYEDSDVAASHGMLKADDHKHDWPAPPGWDESEHDDAVRELSEDEWLKLSANDTTVADGHLNSSELIHERSRRTTSWCKEHVKGISWCLWADFTR